MNKTYLFETITKGDLETLRKEWPSYEKETYVDKPAFVNHAAYHGHLHIVKYFVEELNVVLTNDMHGCGRATLRYTSSSKKDTLDIIKYLFEKGVDITSDNHNAFCWACYKGHLETVKFLVEKGSDINAWDDLGFKTGIEHAAWNGFLPIVQYLCEKGATNLDEALTNAVSNNHSLIVDYLSQKGAKPKKYF